MSYLKTIICAIILLGLGIFFFNKFTNYYVEKINQYVDNTYTRDSIKNDYLREPLSYYLLQSDTMNIVLTED